MSAGHPALRRGGFILYKNTCLPLGVGHERPAQCAVKPHQLCAGAHGVHAALQISHFARELIQVEQAVDIPGRPAVGRIHHLGTGRRRRAAHLHIVLRLPKAQRAARHPAIRDKRLLVGGVLFQNPAGGLGIALPVGAVFRKHQREFAQLCGRA